MKNSLKISVAGEDLISTVDDSTNRLFINGTEVPSTSWTGSGTYSTTVNGHAITITRIENTTGNVAIRRTAAYTYELYKIKSGTTIDGDLIVTGSISEQGAKLATRYQTNRNLLDNWYFIGGGSQQGYGVFPINQRGQGSYSGTGYGIDRWKVRTANAGIQLNTTALRIKASGAISANTRLMQQEMFNLRYWMGKTVTVSILVADCVGTYQFGLRIQRTSNGSDLANVDTNNITSAGLYTATGVVSDTLYEIMCRITNISAMSTSSYIDIKAVKVEFGSSQTLAHQENGSWVLNEIPYYGEELRKCQAYLVPILGNTVRWSPAQITANIIDVTIPVTVPLAKTQPTIVGTTPTVYYNGTAQTGFTFAFTDRGIGMLNSPTVVLRCSKNSHGLSASGNIMVGASTSTTFASVEP